VDNLTLVNSFGTGVEFGFVNNSLITNCTFLGGQWGIYDYSSQGGNRYISNNFDGNQSQAEVVILGPHPLTLEDCRFKAAQ
jgi:parallel beta-helix repeat protein